MPLYEHDPRDLAGYEDIRVPRGVTVPTTDNAAWWLNQDYADVYNKLDLARAQNFQAAPVGLDPPKYPVFLKPIYNLEGGGIDGRIIKSERELRKYERPGMFWMPLLKGRHLSHDFALDNGQVEFSMTMQGYPLKDGMFDFWKTVTPDTQQMKNLKGWLKQNLDGYTGMVNVETIGGKIIEAHLRYGDVWMSGPSMLQSIVNLYAGEGWNYDGPDPKFYVWPVFADADTKYVLPKGFGKQIASRTLAWFPEYGEGDGLTPVGGRRLALFSTKTKQEGSQLRRELLAAFRPKIPQKYTRSLT